MKEKTYYAHHRWKYNTPIEQHELEIIHKHFQNVVNPNGTIDQTKKESEIMTDCYLLINDCDRLIFSTLSGVVGKGVYQEVLHAETAKMPICVIKDNQLIRIDKPKFELIENSDDRIYAIIQED